MAGERKRRLVRARYKAVDDLPEWARCCQRYMADNAVQKEMTVDLSRMETGVMRCRYCKADHGKIQGVMDIADGKFEAIDLLDLDEGNSHP